MKYYTMTDITALSRQVQIAIITDMPNPIVDWFNGIWNQLDIIETDVYHSNGGEIIYYRTIDGKKTMIFYQDDDSGKFWCNYIHYWIILTENYNLSYKEIQSITKILIDNALNNNSEFSIAAPRMETSVTFQEIADIISIGKPTRVYSYPTINHLLDSI
jgi:hypothetical protein